MFISIYDQDLSKEQASAEHLGGKGYGLWWMQQQGVNVPPALILPTTLCAEYRKSPKVTMKAISNHLPEALAFFEEKFGYMPLLSVRSGARASMPGMMDTILNVGLTTANHAEWSARLGQECTENCFDRLYEMYGSTVLGMSKEQLHAATDDYVPQDAMGQVLNCIEAVFKSWDNDRAKFYRKMNNIPEDWGTAVTLQAMVFGNLNENSGTGVLFTRNPDTGENVIVGEFLSNAQGEDVVAGIKTPLPLNQMDLWNKKVATELRAAVTQLETLKGDVQDVEFTVQDGVLYILQTRNAKRSAKAAIQIAMDMLDEELIDEATAISRVTRKEYDLAQQAVLDPKFKKPAKYTGIPACGGVVTAVVVTSAEAAINCKQPCILVTQETTPDDIAGMHAAKAVLTMTGGATSHAAVVARSMNKPCIVGLSVDLKEFKPGSTISIDGSTGRVWEGEVPVIDGSTSPALSTFRELLWATKNALPIGTGAARLVSMADKYTLSLQGQAQWLVEQAAAMEVAYTGNYKLYVDCRLPTDENETAFMGCFIPPTTDPESEFVAFLEQNISPAANVVLITSCDTDFPHIKVVSDIKHLLFAQGDVVMELEMDKYTKRVLELTGSTLTPVVIGAHAEGTKCFMTESQLVVSLLK